MFHVDVASTVQLVSRADSLQTAHIRRDLHEILGELWHCRGRDYYVH